MIRPASTTPIDNANLLAMGSDAANAQIGYAMFNTLFLREHNRIAGEIRPRPPDWKTPTASSPRPATCSPCCSSSVVIEEYINHLHPYHFRFRLDPRGFDKQRWMRPNWVAVEFNLLYRWHSLDPRHARHRRATGPVALADTMYQTKPLLDRTAAWRR